MMITLPSMNTLPYPYPHSSGPLQRARGNCALKRSVAARPPAWRVWAIQPGIGFPLGTKKSLYFFPFLLSPNLLIERLLLQHLALSSAFLSYLSKQQIPYISNTIHILLKKGVTKNEYTQVTNIYMLFANSVTYSVTYNKWDHKTYMMFNGRPQPSILDNLCLANVMSKYFSKPRYQ